MPKPFELLYVAKPYRVNQAWGIENPLYKQFGFSRHNGEDIAPGWDKKIYAPCDGTVVRIGNQPNGGGIFVGIMTPVCAFADRNYPVLIDFLHCEKILVTEGQQVKTGDVLAIADNTGVSTGPHTHIQAKRVAYWNGLYGANFACSYADTNDANNSFNHALYYTGHYAADVTSWRAIVQSLTLLLQRLVEARSIKR